MIYNKITIGGLEVLGNESCPYYSNLYNFLFDGTNTNNDSSLYSDGDYAGTSKRNAKSFTLVTMVKKESNVKAALQLSYILNKKEEIELIADIENLGEVSCKVKTESITTDDFDTITATLKMESMIDKKLESAMNLYMNNMEKRLINALKGNSSNGDFIVNMSNPHFENKESEQQNISNIKRIIKSMK